MTTHPPDPEGRRPSDHLCGSALTHALRQELGCGVSLDAIAAVLFEREIGFLRLDYTCETMNASTLWVASVMEWDNPEQRACYVAALTPGEAAGNVALQAARLAKLFEG